MHSPIARLSLEDESYLRIEDPRSPMHFGVLATLGPGLPVDAHGALDLPGIRRRLERRLDRAPELRRTLRPAPILCGRPMWVDDERFSLDQHVRAAAVSPPGGERELLHAAERLLTPLLDRARPLWELWFLTGLADGGVGLLFKLHHAVTDGLGAVALLGALFDDGGSARQAGQGPHALVDGADDAARTEAVWVAAPAPSPWELFADNARGRLASLSVLLHPTRVACALGSALADSKRMARAWSGAPATSLTGPRTGTMHARVVRLDLEIARRIGHTRGGSVNDVMLAVVAGGLRDLLVARGEAVTGVELKVSVPVALRTARAARELGNAVGTMLVPVQVGEPDAVRRLAGIVLATHAAKAEPPVRADAFISWMAALGLARPMANRQRTFNVFTTNVIGPRAPLHLLGARVEELLPLMGASGNIRLLFAAASYGGQLVVVVNADGSVEDVDVLAAGMQQTWSALVGVHPPRDDVLAREQP
jgi:diacylglycerol O-acyltransferase / wax synthase